MTLDQSWQYKAFFSSRHSLVCEDREESEHQKSRLFATEYKSIPSYLYMMRHTYRAEVLPRGHNVKGFVRTDLAHTLHNNFPIRCLYSVGYNHCNGLEIDPSQSILMHYRRKHDPEGKWAHKNQNCTIHDRIVWQYYDVLERNVRQH